MPKLPFMKFYPSDFIVDTQTLSVEEVGCWIKLMCHIWIQSKTGTIVLSNREISLLWGLPDEEALDIFCRLWDKGIFENKRTVPQEDCHKDDNNYVINCITSRRISKDKKQLKTNAFYVSKHRSKVRGKEKVRDKMSEVRSQKSDKDIKTLEPLKDKGSLQAVQERGPERRLTDVQKVVTVFKLLQGFPRDDKGWDEMYFGRFSKSAAALIKFLGSWKDAADCCEDVYKRLNEKGLTVTMETIVKHAGDWLRDKREKEAKIGILPVPGIGSMSA